MRESISGSRGGRKKHKQPRQQQKCKICSYVHSLMYRCSCGASSCWLLPFPHLHLAATPSLGCLPSWDSKTCAHTHNIACHRKTHHTSCVRAVCARRVVPKCLLANQAATECTSPNPVAPTLIYPPKLQHRIKKSGVITSTNPVATNFRRCSTILSVPSLLRTSPPPRIKQHVRG